MLKFLKFVLLSYLLVAAIGCGIWLVLWRTEGFKLYSVQTGSMAPLLQPGDLAVSIKTTPQTLQIGDIINYQGQAGSVTHRVYQTYPAKGYVITKGDNLAQPDPPVAYKQIAGKTIKVIPGVGRAFDWLRRPVGLISLVYVPAILIMATEMYRLAGYYSRGSYRQTAQQ